jgi:hypothetical protein
LVLGLQWQDDEQASLQFGTTHISALMDGTTVDTQTKERIPECLLMSSGKIQKLMRKTRRSKRRNAEFYLIYVHAKFIRHFSDLTAPLMDLRQKS